MVLTVPKNLTKELIENKISQETLISNYYGVPIQKGLFCAKHRSDKHPTCCYFRNKKNRIVIKDFGSDYYGDWIYVVMNKFNCSYTEALSIAANDFGIQKIPNLKKNTVKLTEEKLPENSPAIIRVETRPFQKYELDWWNRFGISEKTLNKFRVFSCKNIWLNGHLFHLETQNQLIFGYYGGIKDGVEQWKIYFPSRKWKWINNRDSTQLQGARNLPKNGGDYIVITKSLKDVMLLYEFGIPAVAPNSENQFVTESQLEKIKSKFKTILVFYDNDLAGIQGMCRIKKIHPELKFAFIPKKYEAKDISDFYKKYGKQKTKELIDKAIEYYGK